MSCGVTRCHAQIQARARHARAPDFLLLRLHPLCISCRASWRRLAFSCTQLGPHLSGVDRCSYQGALSHRPQRPARAGPVCPALVAQCVVNLCRGVLGRLPDVLSTPAVRLCASLHSMRAWSPVLATCSYAQPKAAAPRANDHHHHLQCLFRRSFSCPLVLGCMPLDPHSFGVHRCSRHGAPACAPCALARAPVSGSHLSPSALASSLLLLLRLPTGLGEHSPAPLPQLFRRPSTTSP
jgi:hypothetical protein